MEGMSAFAGVYGREMRPQRRHMDIALFKAARSGDVQAFRSLLSARHELPSSAFEATVVIHAAEEESKEMIFGVTVGGNTVLHIAAQRGHLDLATEVCRREPSLVAAVNTRLETPLHCCAREGHVHIVSLIINTTANNCSDGGGGAYDLLDVLRARNVHGDIALHEASRSGHAQVAEMLIAADSELASFVSQGMYNIVSPADIIVPSPVTTDTSMSPLYLAVMTKSQSTVEALLQHDSSSFAGPMGKTALHAAVTRCQEITRKILKWKPILGRVVEYESHSTPLHYVAVDGDREMARILLEHDPSTAYISDKDGNFPIHVAAGMNRVNVICEILDQCPDSFELVDNKGRSFLHVAAERSCSLVVELIVNRKRRRDLVEILLNQRDNYGDTPLHLAVHDKWPLLTFTLLLKNMAKLSIMNNLGLTPLDIIPKSELGLRFVYNAREVVTGLLVNCGAIISPRRIDHALQGSNSDYKGDMEDKKNSLSMAKNLAIIAVLFSTVTFAAGFTIPGGYKSEDGTPTMVKKYPFKVFLISNALALLFSLVATMQIINVGTPDVEIRFQMGRLIWSRKMLFSSFIYMSMSFGMAMLVVVAPKDPGIAFLVCILSLAAPVIHIVRMDWSLIKLKRVMIKRNGLMRSKAADPRTEKYFWSPRFYSWMTPANSICSILLQYSFVFLLALL